MTIQKNFIIFFTTINVVSCDLNNIFSHDSTFNIIFISINHIPHQLLKKKKTKTVKLTVLPLRDSKNLVDCFAWETSYQRPDAQMTKTKLVKVQASHSRQFLEKTKSKKTKKSTQKKQ